MTANVMAHLMQKFVSSARWRILAIGESNATRGQRLTSIDLENTEADRQAQRQLSISQYFQNIVLYVS
jgi:fructose-bisphosphate aldolase class I